MAVGSFYTHFASRSDLLDQLLRAMRVWMLDYIRGAIRGSSSFVEMECRGFEALSQFMHAAPSYLRVEMEAALWAPASYMEHFRIVAGHYRRALERSKARGELQSFAPREFDALAYIFISARRYLAMQFASAGVAQMPRHVLDTYADFIGRGLEDCRTRGCAVSGGR